MLKPSTPLAATIVVPTPLTSLKAVRSNVSTSVRNSNELAARDEFKRGGRCEVDAAAGPVGSPMADCWQLAAAKSCRPAAMVWVGRIAERRDGCANPLSDVGGDGIQVRVATRVGRRDQVHDRLTVPDQPLTARDGADVELEVLDLVPDGGPVEDALMERGEERGAVGVQAGPGG